MYTSVHAVILASTCMNNNILMQTRLANEEAAQLAEEERQICEQHSVSQK